MADLTGYVSIRNKCGTAIKDVSLSVTVGETARPILQQGFLSDNLTTLNKKFEVPNGASANWAVSFMLGGVQIDGAVNCVLAAADNNQMLRVTLSADGFTLVPTVSDRVTGAYND